MRSDKDNYRDPHADMECMKTRVRSQDTLIEYKGEKKLLRAWCRELDLPRTTIIMLLREKKTLEEAVEIVRINQWRRKIKKLMRDGGGE